MEDLRSGLEWEAAEARCVVFELVKALVDMHVDKEEIKKIMFRGLAFAGQKGTEEGMAWIIRRAGFEKDLDHKEIKALLKCLDLEMFW